MTSRRRTAIASLAFVAIAVGVSFWCFSLRAPAEVRHAYDVAVRTVLRTDPETRCWERKRFDDGVESFAYVGFIGSRPCYQFEAERKFKGIYIDEFEGQRFIENAVSSPPYHPKDNVWLEIDGKTQNSSAIRGHDNDLTAIWEIEFEGRKARGSGFGHLGMSDGLVVVDQIYSARLLHEQKGYLTDEILIR